MGMDKQLSARYSYVRIHVQNAIHLHNAFDVSKTTICIRNKHKHYAHQSVQTVMRQFQVNDIVFHAFHRALNAQHHSEHAKSASTDTTCMKIDV